VRLRSGRRRRDNNPQSDAQAPLDPVTGILMLVAGLVVVACLGSFVAEVDRQRRDYIVRMDCEFDAPTRCHHKHDIVDSRGHATYS